MKKYKKWFLLAFLVACLMFAEYRFIMHTIEVSVFGNIAFVDFMGIVGTYIIE